MSTLFNMNKRKSENDSNPGHKKPKSGSVCMEEVIKNLEVLSRTTHQNNFVDIIKLQLIEKNSEIPSAGEGESLEVNNSMPTYWTEFAKSGSNLLKVVDDHTHKNKDEKEILKEILNPGYSTIVADILESIGKHHWAVGGLAIAAYLIRKFEKVSANKAAAFELLSNIVDLATSVTKLKDFIEDEKLKKAVTLVMQASLMCKCQIDSPKISRFLRAKVHSENLNKMSKKLHHLYRDLEFAIQTKILKGQKEIEKSLSEIAKRQEEIQSKIEEHLLKIEKGNQAKFEECLSEIAKLRAENQSTSPLTPANGDRLQVSGTTPPSTFPIVQFECADGVQVSTIVKQLTYEEHNSNP